ncbi:MAG: serine dehydratase subunit alpha family protein [Oscillospiraceae bacterium]|nr:serine dehydratase subunit alpha family protein [Oscillospiraceae bacterium]
MNRHDSVYQAYLQILAEELVPAMGCTEPIAIAYAAAAAREELGCRPDRVQIAVSGNIIKNVKSVVVPHTGGLRGIEAAAAAGIVAGKAEKRLEVLSEVSEAQIKEIAAFLRNTDCIVEHADTPFIFDIQITLFAGESSAKARIVGHHTNLVNLTVNDHVLIDRPCEEGGGENKTDRSVLSVEEIVNFADILDPADVREIFIRQIECNMAIAEEGMRGTYGACIGRVLRDAYGTEIHNRARYMAAAGADARMNGCELPVIINSGSGNQGITASVPVIVYARELGVSEEALFRALAVSNLCTIHLKTGIGTLSAYCGAVSAGCGAAAGIAYLHGGKQREIAHTLVNAVAIDSGIICDGAKASCAAKIASAVDAGLLGYQMWCSGRQFYGGDGIVKKGIENTIRTVGELAHRGMVGTDKEIINLMICD